MFAHVSHIMKVGKNNFKPPPAVESSVVRLVPKRPRPQISFEEWDGLLRIVFVRKNRTLRASFLGTTTVMDLLEGNYKTWCAQNDVAIDDGPADPQTAVDMEIDGSEDVDEVKAPVDEDEWEGFMDLDDEQNPPREYKVTAKSGNKRRRKGKVAELVRGKVIKVLEEKTSLADRRARQCDEGDFLRLLVAMNEEGIHFS